MDYTIKKYRLSSVGNNLEFGKRGGMIKFDLVNSKFVFYQEDKSTLSEIEVANGTNNSSAVTLEQLNELKSSYISPFDEISTTTTLSVNKKYYLTSDFTLTLPDTSNTNIGDIIIVRSSNSIVSSTINLHDEVTESIITNAGTSSSFTIDIMGEFNFIYSGSSSWEVLWETIRNSKI